MDKRFLTACGLKEPIRWTLRMEGKPPLASSAVLIDQHGNRMEGLIASTVPGGDNPEGRVTLEFMCVEIVPENEADLPLPDEQYRTKKGYRSK